MKFDKAVRIIEANNVSLPESHTLVEVKTEKDLKKMTKTGTLVIKLNNHYYVLFGNEVYLYVEE